MWAVRDVRLEALADLEAVHLGHHDIEQDDVDLRSSIEGERFGAGRSGANLEILRRQASFEQADIRRNVVNDQHASCQRPAAPSTQNKPGRTGSSDP